MLTGITLVLCITFVITLLLYVPLGFVLGITALAVVLYKGTLPLAIIPQRMILGADSFSLMAVPFFVLASYIMNQGGITRRIISFSNVIVGRFRGGLGLANVAASMLFGGVSGSAVADSTGIGSVIIPAMIDEGYDPDFSAAVTAASSICGPIIPPSVPMVIYGITAEVSIGAMFLAGAVPGILLGLSLMALTYYYAVKRSYPRYGAVSLPEFWRAFRSAIWALLMPVIILGGIFSGVFTVAESAAVAVVYAFLVGMFVYREFRVTDILPMLRKAALDTAVIMFVISVAALFSWVMAISRLPQLLTNWIFSLQLSPIAVLMVLNLCLLFIGTFMEAISAMLIIIPLILPPTKALGIDPIHLGTIIVFNLMLGLLTPPVGLCLYITGRLANISLERVSKAALPFLLVGIGVLLVITLFPGLVLFLPRVWLQ
jgi:C4-dicarboxylate transporter DctM subunit